jgi:hypothetical protein
MNIQVTLNLSFNLHVKIITNLLQFITFTILNNY